MQLPQQLLESLNGLEGYDKESFEALHASGQQVTSVRFNPAKWPPDAAAYAGSGSFTYALLSHVPWSSFGYYLSERPSFIFDPLLHAGAYYVQEASSMFLEQALRQTIDLSRPVKVLDLCAAPGGKSTLLQSLLTSESLLVSNEAIKSRTAVLEENLTKWGAANVVLSHNDPAHFSRLPHYFDIVVVDAPCSGSGLFRRDPMAIQEWSAANVQRCSQRQHRIVADVWPALAPGGIFIYCTCSFSKEENEEALDWMTEKLHAKTKRIALQQEWNIVETISEKQHAYGYRFYPNRLKGEGFFIAVMQKEEDEADRVVKRHNHKIEHADKTTISLLQSWLETPETLQLIKQSDTIIALPPALREDLPVLQAALYIRKAGVEIGKIAGRELVPAHALALSKLVNTNLNRIEWQKKEAIQYLRREALPIQEGHKGWALSTYHGHNLGWVKILANRLNNYYPREWRILKEYQESTA